VAALFQVYSYAAQKINVYDKLTVAHGEPVTIIEQTYTNGKYMHVSPALPCFVPTYAMNTAETWSMNSATCYTVIDTHSRLTVSLYRDAICNRLGVSHVETSALIEKVQKLDTLTKQGFLSLANLKYAAAALDKEPLAVSPVNREQRVRTMANLLREPARNAVMIIESMKDNPELRAELNVALDDAGTVQDQYQCIFTAIQAYLAKIKADIPKTTMSESVHVDVSLTLNRSQDPSRKRGVSPFTPLTEDEKNYTSNIANGMGDLQKTIDDFANEMPAVMKIFGVDTAEQVQQSAQAICDAADNMINAIPQEARSIPAFQNDYKELCEMRDSLQQQVTVLTSLVTELRELQGGSQALLLQQASLRINKLATIISDLKTIVVNLTILIEKTIPEHIQDASMNQFREIINRHAKEMVKEVAKQSGKLLENAAAVTDLLSRFRTIINLFTKINGDMRQVGTQFQSVTIHDPITFVDFSDDFKSSNGKERSLPGDQIAVKVLTRFKEKEVPYEMTFQAYTMDGYWDRIVHTVFTPSRKNGAIRPMVGYSTVYKPGKRGSLLSNQMHNVGWGFSVTTLDTNNDDAYELGIGGVASILDDLLQIGSGFNLQTNRAFVFLGIRLPFSFDLTGIPKT
jgi:hypothetical protein